MKEKMELLIHLIVSFVRLLKPGGMKAVIAETMIMKQQLIVMNRGRGRVLKLGTSVENHKIKYLLILSSK